jgi:hypothetical protein
MKNDNSKPGAAALRQKAEALLKIKSPKSIWSLSEAELLKLFHEFEVHQIELELQNEELQSAHSATLDAVKKYKELYDLAPIGYLILSKEGKIMEINLCASNILGKERMYIINSMFKNFITDSTKPTFNHFLSKIFDSSTKEICEVILDTNPQSPIYAYLLGTTSLNGELCLLTITDISKYRRAEAELEKWAAIFKPKAN